MTAPVPNFAHRAAFLSGHDGDSFWLRVDRGRLTHGILDDPSWYVRLHGIDCWEVSGAPHPLDPGFARGRAARDETNLLLSTAVAIVVQTLHPDDRPPELEKYGRVLCSVWADGELLSDVLRAGGHEKGAA